MLIKICYILLISKYLFGTSVHAPRTGDLKTEERGTLPLKKFSVKSYSYDYF